MLSTKHAMDGAAISVLIGLFGDYPVRRTRILAIWNFGRMPTGGFPHNDFVADRDDRLVALSLFMPGKPLIDALSLLIILFNVHG